MSNLSHQQLIYFIARLWRAGLSGLFLLSIGLLHSATPSIGNSIISAQNEAEVASQIFHREIHRSGQNSQIDVAGNDHDPSSDLPLLHQQQLQLCFSLHAPTTQQLNTVRVGLIAYFIPEPRAAPQANFA